MADDVMFIRGDDGTETLPIHHEMVRHLALVGGGGSYHQTLPGAAAMVRPALNYFKNKTL